MKHFVPFTHQQQLNLVKIRKNEIKFGEHVKVLSDVSSMYDEICNLDVDYVIFGISEDIGVYANHGKIGTRKAWHATLNVLLNQQSNRFVDAKRILVLGHLAYLEIEEVVGNSQKKDSIKKARTFTESIDKDVSHLVSLIVKAGKIPIVIGGGHNNSYGSIKGTALAINQKINVVNFDAHTDFRSEEGRHSGNGFSYAYSEGFLKNYFMFGIHEAYTSEKILKTIKKLKSLKYNTYETIEVRQELDFYNELKKAKNFINNKPFGIELDCDAIKNIPSSAITSTGFSVKQARQFVYYFGSDKNATYLHICEAAPKKKSEALIGKLISELIIDFIKAHSTNK